MRERIINLSQELEQSFNNSIELTIKASKLISEIEKSNEDLESMLENDKELMEANNFITENQKYMFGIMTVVDELVQEAIETDSEN